MEKEHDKKPPGEDLDEALRQQAGEVWNKDVPERLASLARRLGKRLDERDKPE